MSQHNFISTVWSSQGNFGLFSYFFTLDKNRGGVMFIFEILFISSEESFTLHIEFFVLFFCSTLFKLQVFPTMVYFTLGTCCLLQTSEYHLTMDNVLSQSSLDIWKSVWNGHYWTIEKPDLPGYKINRNWLQIIWTSDITLDSSTLCRFF